ncbi:MAG: caspase family protein [Thermoanaerobaculia bacterium]
MKHLIFAIQLLLPGVALGLPSTSPEFRNSYALIVGVNDYSGAPGWPNLAYAEHDAKFVGAYFRSQGYDVRVMTDGGTRRNIVAHLLDDLAPRLGSDDRVVFYFGGHGHTETTGGRQVGYILPAGVRSSADYISMGDLRTYAERLGSARHMLFIINACYGGTLGSLRGGGVDPSRPNYRAEVMRRHARQFISSGGANQQVLDGGPGNLSWFTYYLLEALQEGKADTNDDHLITFSELNGYLVPRASNEVQTPAWGALGGHALGEFVFRTDMPASLRRLALPLASPDTAPRVRLEHSSVPTSDPTTRESDLPTVTRNMEAMRAPMDRLFTAWESLDLDLYMAQWAPTALQYSRRFRRSHDDILEKRQRDFQRLERVAVLGYEVAYAGFYEETAHFNVKYSLRFVFKDGKVITENQIGERYETRYSPAVGRWQISVNQDYISRGK